MKQKLYTFLSLWISLVTFLLFLPQTKLQAAGNKTVIVARKSFDDDKKRARKEKAMKSQSVVKVFPDPIKKAMHVVARSGNEKDIDFFVFDANGNMILNYKMKAGERRTIGNLKRGSYMYHVFAEDQYLAAGKMEFR